MGGGMDGTEPTASMSGFPLGARQYITIAIQRHAGHGERTHVTVPTIMTPNEARQTAALFAAEANRLAREVGDAP